MGLSEGLGLDFQVAFDSRQGAFGLRCADAVRVEKRPRSVKQEPYEEGVARERDARVRRWAVDWEKRMQLLDD